MSTCFDSTSACYYVIWGLALKLLGLMNRRESEWVQEANICVNIVIGNLWRCFHVVFSNWPWRLHIIVHVDIDVATRRAVAQEFLDTVLCCLGERHDAMQYLSCATWAVQHPSWKQKLKLLPIMLNLNGSHNVKMCVDDSRNDDDDADDDDDDDDDHEHDDDEDNHDDHDYNDGDEDDDDDDVDLSPSHHSRLVLMMAMTMTMIMIEVMIMITLMISHRPTQILISLYGAAVRAGRTFRG